MLKGYVPMTLCRWENLEVSSVLQVNLKGPGLGCLLVWPTMEEAQENCPNSEIIEIEIGIDSNKMSSSNNVPNNKGNDNV